MDADQLDATAPAAIPAPAPAAPAPAPAAPAPTRRARIRAAAAARGVPLAAILVTVGVVVLTYLVGQLVYRLRDVILLMVVGGFIALILNPFVVPGAVAYLRLRLQQRKKNLPNGPGWTPSFNVPARAGP
jgi:hypothetical protein